MLKCKPHDLVCAAYFFFEHQAKNRASRDPAGKCDFSLVPLWSLSTGLLEFIIRAEFLWIMSDRFGDLIDLLF